MSERTAAELRALRASEHPSDVLDLAIEALEAREVEVRELRKAAEEVLRTMPGVRIDAFASATNSLATALRPKAGPEDDHG